MLFLVLVKETHSALLESWDFFSDILNILTCDKTYNATNEVAKPHHKSAANVPQMCHKAYRILGH